MTVRGRSYETVIRTGNDRIQDINVNNIIITRTRVHVRGDG